MTLLFLRLAMVDLRISSVGSRTILGAVRPFLIFWGASDAGRKSAGAAAMTSTSVAGSLSATASDISRTVSVFTVTISGGSGTSTCPTIKVTSAPRRQAARASATPIFPLL